MVPSGDPSISIPGSSGDQVHVTLELSAQDLGTDPPPSRCHVRAYKTTAGWVLLVWSPYGPNDAIKAWAKAQTSSDEIAFGEVGERTTGFQCEALPPTWETLFGLFDIHHLIMDADGTTLTHLEGPREEIGEFLVGLDLEVSAKSVEMVPEVDERTREEILTEAQEHAIGRAAALGYFDVPRRIHLEDLADELGTSPSALSELLRRAQARLVSTYLDNELGGLGAVLDIDEASN